MKSGTPVAIGGEETENEEICGSVTGSVHATEAGAKMDSSV